MELYELVLHFPPIYGTLENEEIEFHNLEYCSSHAEAIKRAEKIASAFVTPRPNYFHISACVGGGETIWTNNVEAVKKALKYEIVATKPLIIPL